LGVPRTKKMRVRPPERVSTIASSSAMRTGLLSGITGPRMKISARFTT
jgi:hypothetical protein